MVNELEPWEGVIGVEGVISVDGRMIRPQATLWRPLPLPLMACRDDGLHMASAEPIGLVEEIWRHELPVGAGVLLLARGAADLTKIVSWREPDGCWAVGMDMTEPMWNTANDDGLLVITAGEIIAVTVYAAAAGARPAWEMCRIGQVS